MALTFKTIGMAGFVEEADIRAMQSQMTACNKMLSEKTGEGCGYLGWLELPFEYDHTEFERIQQAAARICNSCEVFIVIGIGGSYLGARAAIEFVRGQHYNAIHSGGVPEIYFAGNNLSSTYLNDLIQIVGERNLCINVISKSGTTTEPALAFRVFRKIIEEKYGVKEAKNHIFITTDAEKGALKQLADREGYQTFVVPDDVGGRYSVLTAVGLLPIAVAGIDLSEVMRGAQDACAKYRDGDLDSNDCFRYAALRNILYRKGKQVDMLVNFEPALVMFGEWFKQLFAESEGKQHKGIFPCAANFSTDLHSIGQYIQDGTRNLFETVIWVKTPKSELYIEQAEEDIDGLNYLAGKSIQYINEKAYAGSLLAHMDGGTPNMLLEIDQADAYHFGYLVYFFEKACGLSGYLMGVNPFDQPGVEQYKRNMFALLGKDGFEQLRHELEGRLRE